MFLVDGILRCLHIHRDQVVLATCFNAVSGVVDHRHVGAVGIFKEALKVLLKEVARSGANDRQPSAWPSQMVLGQL